VTLLGIVTLVSPLQDWNAYCPIDTTGRLLICDGILTLTSVPLYAYESILTPPPYEEYVKLPDVAAEAGPIRPTTMSRERMYFFMGRSVCSPDNTPIQAESETIGLHRLLPPYHHQQSDGSSADFQNCEKCYCLTIMQGTGHLGLLLAGHVGTLIGCFDHT